VSYRASLSKLSLSRAAMRAGLLARLVYSMSTKMAVSRVSRRRRFIGSFMRES